MMSQQEFDDLGGLLAAPIPRRRAISLFAGSALSAAVGLRSRSAAAATQAPAAVLDGSKIEGEK